MHFGPFGCLSKLSAKRAELVQKFVPWSSVGIFRIEASNPPHWTLTSCFCAFRTIWVHFGTVWFRYQTHCKTGQISAKVGATKSRRNFSQECTRSTPLDSKLIFWCVLYYLDAFGTVWLPYKTQCKTGWTGAKVLGTKSHHNFSQRTHPIDPVGT